jgi:hypothetical protein
MLFTVLFNTAKSETIRPTISLMIKAKTTDLTLSVSLASLKNSVTNAKANNPTPKYRVIITKASVDVGPYQESIVTGNTKQKIAKKPATMVFKMNMFLRDIFIPPYYLENMSE